VRATSSTVPWWRTAVTYEVYLRSFAHAGEPGNASGNIAGLRSRLPHLADLGIDAIWISPWYPSPMADGGYDVIDHRAIDPAYGTLADADALLSDAHALGIRVILDLVANHTSDRHPWFTAALTASPGAPERDRYHFRDGRGPGGAEPPNDWISAFGGPAWTRVPGTDGRAGQWYLHLFAPEQPDLNWQHPDVVDEFDGVLRFWLDRGVDGIRADAVSAMAKVAGLPDAGHAPGARFAPATWHGNPHWDVDGVHDILRRWRKIADSYGDVAGGRAFVVEAVVNGPERLARYLRADEMHTAFNFDFLHCTWDARALREVVDATLAALAPVGASPTWVLSSHDETRHATRFGRRPDGSTDHALGLRRARAAALLMLALPGGAYLYQGEELGLPEVDDLPEHALQDPTWERSGRTERGRDGCRVPLPWSGDEPPYGFTAPGTPTWLPQPAGWGALTADAQRATPGSTLRLYRDALRLRRSLPALHGAEFDWCAAPDGVLAFDRGDGFGCAVNLSGTPVPLPGDPLLVSSPLDGGRLAPETAAWYVAHERITDTPRAGERITDSARTIGTA
jgi:alpha-glucosidase